MSVVATHSPWATPTTSITPLPDQVDIAVVGAGLAGMHVAVGLAESGARVLVLDSRTSVGAGMSSRGLGIADPLLLDPPHRLIAATGLQTARSIVAFTQESLDLFGDKLRSGGVYTATKGEQEAAEVDANLEALEALGLPAREWQPAELTGLDRGWHQPVGGTIDPDVLLADLAHRAGELGVHLALGCPVRSFGDTDGDPLVQTDLGTVRASLVVVATNALTARLLAWCDDKIHPVRHQAIATAPVETRLPAGVSIQYGYTRLRQTPDGQIIVAGCRWATPHLEVGEDDDTVIQGQVDARLRAFLGFHLPDVENVQITHQWSGIMGFTCDGLPLVGPIPGRPRFILCAGFGGFQDSLAPRAAAAVVEGVRTSRAPGVPNCFTPQRFA